MRRRISRYASQPRHSPNAALRNAATSAKAGRDEPDHGGSAEVRHARHGEERKADALCEPDRFGRLERLRRAEAGRDDDPEEHAVRRVPGVDRAEREHDRLRKRQPTVAGDEYGDQNKCGDGGRESGPRISSCMGTPPEADESG